METLERLSREHSASGINYDKATKKHECLIEKIQK